MRGSTAVSVNTCVIFFFFFFSLRISLTCCAHVRMFCVNQLSGRERGGKEKKGGFFFFFPRLASRWVNLCFIEIKYGLHLPPLQPPDGPCGERVIIWPIWAREPESVDVGWAVRCHAKPPVPRSLNMIPFTCPLSLVLSLPPPPHHRLDLLQLPPPSSSSTSSSPPLSVSTLG